MNKSELETWLIAHGYTQDKHGHYKKQVNGNLYRFKLQDISARYEKRIHVIDKNEWLRLRSGYYKDLSINPDGKLCGLK